MENRKIECKNNKTLKLSNVIIKEVTLDENTNLMLEVKKMENYIKNKGAVPVGPFIQYTKIGINGIGAPTFVYKTMIQVDVFIENNDNIYDMSSIIKVENCLYARFNGLEKDIKFVYDKINVLAYEENLKLNQDTYTVIVSKDDDEIIADIFMELDCK